MRPSARRCIAPHRPSRTAGSTPEPDRPAPAWRFTNLRYEDDAIDTRGLPARHKAYEFTVGVLSNGGRDIEFGMRVDRMSGQYSVTPDELLEIKGRAAKLFAQAPASATKR